MNFIIAFKKHKFKSKLYTKLKKYNYILFSAVIIFKIFIHIYVQLNSNFNRNR
jgi:hypothetical protein